MNIRVLLVDDEAEIVRSLARLLRRSRPDWRIETTTSAASALELIAHESPYHAVVSDLRMPVMDGSELLERVAEHSPGCARILMSGHAAFESGGPVAGVHEALGKPCSRDDIVEAIERTLGTLAPPPPSPG